MQRVCAIVFYEVIVMAHFMDTVHAPLFEGIPPEERITVLSCFGYYLGSYQKGEPVAMEGSYIRHFGVVLSGSVDMVKEDIWGNRTLLVRAKKDDVFGESFACGEDKMASVGFYAYEDASVLFLSFDKVMHNCANACQCHHKLTDNMVRVIAAKNRELMRKVEVVSKRTIREKVLTYLSLQAQSQQSRYVELPMGRLELAEYLCVDRSALTRELAKMQEEGIIDFDKNIFRIL